MSQCRFLGDHAMLNATSRFIVLKFGGTSVSTRSRWDTIGDIALQRAKGGQKPVVVCSALSGVSNALDALARAILEQADFRTPWEFVQKTHRDLCDAMGLDFQQTAGALFAQFESDFMSGLLTLTPRDHASIMAFGELMSTHIGHRYLKAQGLNIALLDARHVLCTEIEPFANEQRSYLGGYCNPQEDPSLQQELLAMPEAVILTQGFIARNQKGHTVLLGRGGSDTSAAYFAAKIQASACEIWTDVPGMYTANPRQVQKARLLKQLDYDEAQEMATMGAQVLHRRCLSPLRQHQIPLHIRCTQAPELLGTTITQISTRQHQIRSIATKSNIELLDITVHNSNQEIGFLADLFLHFKQSGVPVDLVSTSEGRFRVSVDVAASAISEAALDALCNDLQHIAAVTRISGCMSISLIGKNLRSGLHHLSQVLEVFEKDTVYLMEQSANNQSLSLLTTRDAAERLLGTLHRRLFESLPADEVFGPSWQDTFGQPNPTKHWWEEKKEQLLALAEEASPQYVYDEESLEKSAQELLGLRSVGRVFYAVKANNNAHVLNTFYRLGLGFECVSEGELNHLLAVLPQLSPNRILFSPNFAPKAEYETALRLGCWVTIDNLYALSHWPDLFRDQNLFLRIDPGQGKGHHRHVHTGGEQSKFGIAASQLEEAKSLVEACGAKVVGLHAHAGSGIADPRHWAEIAQFLIQVAADFKDVRMINLGGGLTVRAHDGEDGLALSELNAALATVTAQAPQYEFWLEPGRYLVAEAGVLLARVTQIKEKGHTCFVGVDVGMNSLIRPALYEAYHHIVNLSQLDTNVKEQPLVEVVGPICESADTLGHHRALPATTREGDVILIATAGAYGHVMGSRYNLREIATERFLHKSKQVN